MQPSRYELRLLREGVEAGDAVMQRELGICCYFGDGVPQDYREAARLFRLAADQDDAEAQYMLAMLHTMGRGVEKDEMEGVRLWIQAAEQGHADSQRELALAGFTRVAGEPAGGGLTVEVHRAGAVPRELARTVARSSQSEDPRDRVVALSALAVFAGERAVARTCCIGCGKTEQLQVCAKCRTAKFCSRECKRRMWPAHKQACKAWAEQMAAAAAEAGGASSSALAEPGEDQTEEAA
jgi:hypothetical protein